MDARLILVVFVLVAVTAAGAQPSSCSEEKKLGTILGITSTPADAKQGEPVDFTLRLKTTLKPFTAWNIGKYTRNVQTSWPVTDKTKGSIRGSSKKEGSYFSSSKIYTYTLHMDAYEKDYHYSFGLHLAHECNTIMFILNNINHWKNVTNFDLPTALAVPRSVIDMRERNQESTAVGIKADPAVMTIGGAYFHLGDEWRGDRLYPRGSGPGGSEGEAVEFDWLPEGRGGRGQWSTVGSIKGKIMLQKKPKDIGKIKSVTLDTYGRLQIGPNYMSVRTRSNILLDTTTKPAVGLFSYQYNQNMLGSGWMYFARDGTRVIPYVNNPNITLPRVLECYGMAGLQRPYIAAARIIRRDGGSIEVVERLNGLYASQGDFAVAYQAYEMPALPLGQSAEYVCSAGAGGNVTNLFFKVESTETVRVSSLNETTVPLTAETFNESVRFSCRAKGFPTPTIKFYKYGQYGMYGAPYIGRGMGEEDLPDEIQGGRFTTTASGGVSTLTISPGPSPYPYDKKFRIVCVAMNDYTGDVAYIDFIPLEQHLNGI